VKLLPEPYLHRGHQQFYNPLTHRTLGISSPDFPILSDLVGGRRKVDELAPEVRTRLAQEGWLFSGEAERDTRYYLRYVSLEANSECNQACYFCPVSVAPRPLAGLTLELYERIVQELAAIPTIEAVFMNQYNEPTTSRDFPEHVRLLKENGLPVALLTNGTGLTPSRVDKIRDLGGLDFLCINISTLEAQRYEEQRGRDHLGIVLKNLDYMMKNPISKRNEMVVLGTETDEHELDYEAIRQRFESVFKVRFEPANDRSGYLGVGRATTRPKPTLRGCEQTGSRPLQHLHITADAKAVICCQDYEGRYVVGDLTSQSVQQVLTGPDFARIRRQVYGLEGASDTFICRRCQFAL
jgi:hypothetical protein